MRQKLLRALRKHVFNTMPIRLLCFEPQGESDFQITLLERGAIYARLATTLEGNNNDEELLAQMTRKRSTRRKGTEQEVIERLISKHTRYAILSHTWLRTVSSEVTYDDWNKGRLETNDPGYQKLVNFCKTAWKDHHVIFGWMDTLCINKESSSELDESIRSMYNWYSRSAVCITYLAETGTLSDMHADPWFTRGWTLQELLAPSVIKFYNADWNQLVDSSDNDKLDAAITKQIERATTIIHSELYNVRLAPISRRMQLAATREVTREEDTSYSLMGIFDVSISTAYGEGARHAFSRLLQAIFVSSNDVLDILNCAGEDPLPRPYNSRVLPSSPQNYINRSSNERLCGNLTRRLLNH
ncbi:hypothetical protein BJ912DRAFT_490976 [Pholiota molesta]|nr:hypothetical protein BJ912DRAFT_490976 [Pholiota molesta]